MLKHRPVQLSESLSTRKVRPSLKRQRVGYLLCSNEGLFERSFQARYLSRNTSSHDRY